MVKTADSKTENKCNYNGYVLSTKEKCCCGIQVIVLISAINYLCYRSWWCYLFVLPVGIYYFKWVMHQKILERKRRLKNQFEDVLHGLQSAIKAGYSMEQAIRECKKEMIQIYGRQQEWVHELTYMENQMAVGQPIEYLWMDLGKRSHVEDIREFADIFMICRRSGGNLGKVLQKCEQILGEKLRTEQEIEVTIAGKKFEQTIMSLVPAGMILYMQFTSESFLGVLYHNVLGVIVMSICLFLYIVSFRMGRKLVRIEV